MTAYPYFN